MGDVSFGLIIWFSLFLGGLKGLKGTEESVAAKYDNLLWDVGCHGILLDGLENLERIGILDEIQMRIDITVAAALPADRAPDRQISRSVP